MALRMIQVGTGGFGARWCMDFLPPNVEAGLIEVVAAVDTNPAALANAGESLGLGEAQCYTDIQQAFDENPADFCTAVVPPFSHEAVVDAALAHDLHILSEKPIADTLVASVRIADKVTQADKKMAVTMSHRFNQYKTTLREGLRSGRLRSPELPGVPVHGGGAAAGVVGVRLSLRNGRPDAGGRVRASPGHPGRPGGGQVRPHLRPEPGTRPGATLRATDRRW